MTALILVVDDLPANVKLLEAKLQAEYYDVITAADGFQAIEQAKAHAPDIILLDVMMPGMDGFEACQELKKDPQTSHIPVVMVTALSEMSDRIKGLQAGADDFLTKPIKEVQLMARVKSLVRVKQMIDELRLRDKTSAEIGIVTGNDLAQLDDIHDAHVLIVDDDLVQGRNMQERLRQEGLHVVLQEDPAKTMETASADGYDLIIISTQLMDMDALRLCSQLRSNDRTRHISQMILIEEDEDRALLKGLEMGVNDYIISPIDLNELICRCRTNIRRKRFQEALKQNYENSVSMAVTDNLTGLYNRHYLSAHLSNLVSRAYEKGRPLSCLIMDMDHFKEVNDTYGHDCGDQVLVELAKRIRAQTRGADLVARFGGEEFVIILPDTGMPQMRFIAERIRQAVGSVAFPITHQVGQIEKTISIGGSMLRLADGPGQDNADAMLKRADEALYFAKNNGRNQVAFAEEDEERSLPPESTTQGWEKIENVGGEGAAKTEAKQQATQTTSGAASPALQAPSVTSAYAPSHSEPPAISQPETPKAVYTPPGGGSAAVTSAPPATPAAPAPHVQSPVNHTVQAPVEPTQGVPVSTQPVGAAPVITPQAPTYQDASSAGYVSELPPNMMPAAPSAHAVQATPAAGPLPRATQEDNVPHTAPISTQPPGSQAGAAPLPAATPPSAQAGMNPVGVNPPPVQPQSVQPYSLELQLDHDKNVSGKPHQRPENNDSSSGGQAGGGSTNYSSHRW